MQFQNTFCMISGDLSLFNGLSKSLQFTDASGTSRVESYMTYTALIPTQGTKIQHRSNAQNVIVDVWAPRRFLSVHTLSAFANIHGRLFLPSYDLNLDGNSDYVANDKCLKNPVIEVVAITRHAYACTPENYVRPTIYMVGRIFDRAIRHPSMENWRTMDLMSRTFIKKVQMPMRIR